MTTINPNGVAFANSGGSLLDAGRRINRSGIGMSANSRQALEQFYGNATLLFNQLYTAAEDQQLSNTKQILALRSLHKHSLSETVTETAASTTSGTNVDTKA